MHNRIYWGGDAPTGWKRASPMAPSIPSVAFEDFETAAPASSKTYCFVISTATVDRSGDSISVSGWDLKAYRRNPTVLFAHDASSWPVGRATKIAAERDRLVAEVQFADTFEGRKAQHLVETGHLKATSVGFVPRAFEYPKDDPDRVRQGGVNFTKQELLEFSIVPVPANPDCLICMSAEEERQERKAELRADLAAIQAKGRELDARFGKVSAPEKPSPVLAQIRARRAERQRISAMDPNEHREFLNSRLERKEELRLRRESLGARS